MNDFENNKGEVVVFLHIPKTAGTTLRYIIQHQHQYKPQEICELYGLGAKTYSERLNKLKELSTVGKKGVRVINSHLGFGLHEYLASPYTYITFLRNPVDRVISFYYYLQRTQKEKFQNISLQDYACNNWTAKNGMTRYLSGSLLKHKLTTSGTNLDYLECSSKMLDAAKENLKDHVKVTGITERFDESLVLLNKLLGWKIPPYNRGNVSKNRPVTRDISKEAIRSIEKLNEFDLQLYDYAKEVFEDLVRQQGSCFEREVNKLKVFNELSKSKPYFQISKFCSRVVHRTYKELARR